MMPQAGCQRDPVNIETDPLPNHPADCRWMVGCPETIRLLAKNRIYTNNAALGRYLVQSPELQQLLPVYP
jgi:hypothetical protein